MWEQARNVAQLLQPQALLSHMNRMSLVDDAMVVEEDRSTIRLVQECMAPIQESLTERFTSFEASFTEKFVSLVASFTERFNAIDWRLSELEAP